MQQHPHSNMQMRSVVTSTGAGRTGAHACYPTRLSHPRRGRWRTPRRRASNPTSFMSLIGSNQPERRRRATQRETTPSPQTVLAATTTEQPCLASARQHSRPIPRLPPVTRATLPFSDLNNLSAMVIDRWLVMNLMMVFLQSMMCNLIQPLYRVAHFGLLAKLLGIQQHKVTKSQTHQVMCVWTSLISLHEIKQSSVCTHVLKSKLHRDCVLLPRESEPA
jgi:hypothetical protein